MVVFLWCCVYVIFHTTNVEEEQNSAVQYFFYSSCGFLQRVIGVDDQFNGCFIRLLYTVK